MSSNKIIFDSCLSNDDTRIKYDRVSSENAKEEYERALLEACTELNMTEQEVLDLINDLPISKILNRL